MADIRPKVSVVVLNWNGKNLLEELMPNWVRYVPGDTAKLIIADNHSEDGSVEFLKKTYPQTEQILFSENYGFADGYNRVLKMVNTPYTVLLNSDAALSEGWLDEPVRILEEDTTVAAVQPKIRSYRNPQSFEYAGAAGGFIDRWGYPFCRGRIFDAVEKDCGQYDREQGDIFWASGAALIVRTRDYIEAGGLDPLFFAHQEEIDLCWRFKARAKRVIFTPLSTVYHIGGASLDMNNPRKVYLNFRNNLLMLYKNLPAKRLHRVMFVRYWLDHLSALMFLLKGNRKHAVAALKARQDYKKMRKNFKAARLENLSYTIIEWPRGMKHYSIVWEYFIRKRAAYSVLPKLK